MSPIPANTLGIRPHKQSKSFAVDGTCTRHIQDKYVRMIIRTHTSLQIHASNHPQYSTQAFDRCCNKSEQPCSF
eukprot:scaffold7382_cov41-Prasinocladus_malaysianus.AAC.1